MSAQNDAKIRAYFNEGFIYQGEVDTEFEIKTKLNNTVHESISSGYNSDNNNEIMTDDDKKYKLYEFVVKNDSE